MKFGGLIAGVSREDVNGVVQKWLSVDRLTCFFQHNVKLQIVFIMKHFFCINGFGNLLESAFQNRHGQGFFEGFSRCTT
jgi:hypothetical protein